MWKPSTGSISINSGETLGLVGESGSGKTTIGRVLLRLLTETKGEIFFDGEDITKLSGADIRKLRRQMQIIFPGPYASLQPTYDCGDIISEPLQTTVSLRASRAGP